MKSGDVTNAGSFRPEPMAESWVMEPSEVHLVGSFANIVSGCIAGSADRVPVRAPDPACGWATGGCPRPGCSCGRASERSLRSGGGPGRRNVIDADEEVGEGFDECRAFDRQVSPVPREAQLAQHTHLGIDHETGAQLR